MTWPVGYAHRKRHRVDRTKVTGTVEGMPVTIPISADADIVAGALPDFRDVLVTDLNDNPLPFQLETPGGQALAHNAGACWFNAPRAAAWSDYLYWSDVSGVTGDIRALARHLTDGALQTATLKAGPLDRDDHDAAGILKLTDGNSMWIYSEHSVPSTNMWMRKTTTPGDLSTLTSEVALTLNANTNGFAYPKPSLLTGESNRIYLVYRSGSNLDQYIAYSDDGGSTWTNKIMFSNRAGPGIQRPYFHVTDNGTDRIDFWCTDGHPRELPTGTSMYHFYLTGGSFYKTDGTLISTLAGLGATGMNASMVTKVYDGALATTAHGKAWGWDLTRDNTTGVITALFAVFPATTPDSAIHHYYRAQWTPAGGWTYHKITEAGSWIPSDDATGEPQYSGGMNLSKTDPNVVVASVQTGDEAFNIHEYATADDGASWTYRAITQGDHPSIKNIRPVCPTHLGGLTQPVPTAVWDRGRFDTFLSYNLTKFAYGPGITPAPVVARVKAPAFDTAWDLPLHVYYGSPTADVTHTAPYDAATIRQWDLEGHLFTGSGKEWENFDSQPIVAGLDSFSVDCEFTSTNNGSDGISDTIVSNWFSFVGVLRAGFLLRIRSTGNLDAFTVKKPATSVGGAFVMPHTLRDGARHRLQMDYSSAGGLRVWCDGLEATPDVGVSVAGGAIVDETPSGQSIRMGVSPHDLTPARYFQGGIHRVLVSNVARGPVWNAARGHDGVDLLLLGLEEDYVPTSAPAIAGRAGAGLDTPRLSLPLRSTAAGHLAAVEQDTVDDIAQCVEVIVRTPEGSRLELPAFGVPDDVFTETPLDTAPLQAAIERWEPRASLLIEQDPEAFRDAVTVALNIDVGALSG